MRKFLVPFLLSVLLAACAPLGDCCCKKQCPMQDGKKCCHKMEGKIKESGKPCPLKDKAAQP